jgi:hypothetical protein
VKAFVSSAAHGPDALANRSVMAEVKASIPAPFSLILRAVPLFAPACRRRYLAVFFIVLSFLNQSLTSKTGLGNRLLAATGAF